MEQLKDKYQFHVSYEPFLLRPGTPIEGVPATKYSEDNPRLIMVKEAGRSVGIEFKKPPKTPNTLQAHTLMRFAKDYEGGKYSEQLSEEIYKAHFMKQVFLDSKALVNIAVNVGLKKEQVKAFINDEESLEKTREISKNWARDGVSGVPCVYMNGQRVFRGAQDVDTFVKTIEKVAEKYPLTTPSSL